MQNQTPQVPSTRTFTMMNKMNELAKCWSEYELNKAKNELEEMEMNGDLPLDDQQSYQAYTMAYSICKRKLFNLVAEYRSAIGQFTMAAMEQAKHKEDIDEFLTMFQQNFSHDSTNNDIIEIHDNTLNSLKVHQDLRLESKPAEA